MGNVFTDALDVGGDFKETLNPFASNSKRSLSRINYKGTNIDIPVVYGEDEVPAIWVGARKRSNTSWSALAVFCYAPIEKIEWVEINGYRATVFYNSSGLPSKGYFYDEGGFEFDFEFRGWWKNDRLFKESYDGADPYPPPEMGLGSDGPRFFSGLVGGEFIFWPKKGLVNGFPDVTIRVKGRNLIYDPRVDAEPGNSEVEYAWRTPYANGKTMQACTNPALIKADYLTNKYYGKGLSWDQINKAKLIEAANICDTNVLDGDGQYINLMSFSGRLDTSNKIDENLEMINKHMRGHSAYELGQFKFLIRDDAPTPDTIPKRWIIKQGNLNRGEKSERLNQCIVTYKEPEYDLDDNQVIWPPIGSTQHNDYLTEDGGEELTEEITLEGCRNRYQAIDYAESIVRESRLQLATSLELLAPAIKYSAGDVVDVDLEGRGLTRVRILEVTERPNHTVIWKVREHSNDAYPWTTKSSILLPAKEATNPIAVDAPTGLNFTAADYNDFSAGVLAWDEIENPMVKGYRVTVTNTDTGRVHHNLNTTDTSIEVPSVPSGNYSMSVAAVLSVTIGPQAAIAVVVTVPVIEPITGLAVVDFTGPDCKFKWNAPTNSALTVHQYVVQIRDVATDNLIFTGYTKNTAYNFDYEQNKASGLNREFKIKVFAQGRFGQDNVDTGAASVIASNALPALPNNLSFSSKANEIKVTFDRVTDPDFKDVCVWLSESAGTNPTIASKRLSIRSNSFVIGDLKENTKYYLYLSVRDLFHDSNSTGVISSELAVYTLPDALKESREAIENIRVLDDQQALNELLNTDNTIVNRRETKSLNSRVLEVEVVQQNYAARLVQVESGVASAGVILEAMEENGVSRSNAGLFVDVDGALSGVFTSANGAASEIVFKADQFRFLTGAGATQPLSVIGNDVVIDNAIIKSNINLNDNFIVDSAGNAVLKSASLTGSVKSSGINSSTGEHRLRSSASTYINANTPNGTQSTVLSIDTRDQGGVAGISVLSNDTYGIYAYSSNGDAVRGISNSNDGVNGTSSQNGKAGVRASNEAGPALIIGNNNEYSNTTSGLYQGSTLPWVTIGGLLYGGADRLYFGCLDSGGNPRWALIDIAQFRNHGDAV